MIERDLLEERQVRDEGGGKRVVVDWGWFEVGRKKEKLEAIERPSFDGDRETFKR